MDEESRKQSPIFNRTWDFLLWLQEHTGKFPKSERFRLAKRLDDSAFDFYETLLYVVHSSQKERYLRKADMELDKIRFYLRMTRTCGLISPGQYRHAAAMLVEMGKLLGGWLKRVKTGTT